VLGEKLGDRPADHSAGLSVVSGALFLETSRACLTLLMTYERFSRTGTTRMKRTLGVRGLAWEAYMLCWSNFFLRGVHRFESPRLSDMSNRLFVAVIMWIITELDGLMLLMVYGYAYCDIPPLSRDGQS
jgi:hypothetical protein